MLTLNRPIILGIGTMFLTGMCVAHWRLERAFTKPLAPALALVVLACIFAYWTGVHTQHPPPLAGLPFAVLVMWAAFTPCLAWLRPFNRRVDLSYGTYLYGWPVQKLLLLALPGLALPAALALGLAGGLGCGMLSWHLVEKRALHSKPRK